MAAHPGRPRSSLMEQQQPAFAIFARRSHPLQSQSGSHTALLISRRAVSTKQVVNTVTEEMFKV